MMFLQRIMLVSCIPTLLYVIKIPNDFLMYTYIDPLSCLLTRPRRIRMDGRLNSCLSFDSRHVFLLNGALTVGFFGF
jgi:hypothetical protein